MVFFRVVAAVLLSAAAWAAESPVVGKWSCTNVQAAGPESPWTLVIRADGAKLAGLLTDGSVEIALSQIQLDGSTFTFRFDINGKPYAFEGKADDRRLEGKYSGEEASGTLRCAKQ